MSFQMSGNVTATTLPSVQNGSTIQTSLLPTNTVITSPAQENTTSGMTSNQTQLQPLIFLQTQAAQGIAGTFAFAAILITCHQVSVPSSNP